MDAMIRFRDAYAHVPAHPEDADSARQTLERLRAEYPSARTYEFLPIATLQLATKSEASRIASIPGVEDVVRASAAFSKARSFYDQALRALSAIRNQSASQRWQWHTACSEGAAFPNDAWCGGLWPAQPYPVVEPSSRVLVRADPRVITTAPPAHIPVVSLSIGPPCALPLEPNDPLAIALTAMTRSHLVVVAAGNYGPASNTMNPWAVVDRVLSVGAMETTTTLWPSSSRGPKDGSTRGPGVVTDGHVSVPSDIGTSYATPRVAMLGLWLAAVVAHIGRALESAQGVSGGISNQALAIADISAESMNIEQASLPPFIDTPALPVVDICRAGFMRLSRSS
jgi:hypothetical protein